MSEFHTKTNSADSLKIIKIKIIKRLRYLKESLKGEAATLYSRQFPVSLGRRLQ
jgi:hypothetical protein